VSSSSRSILAVAGDLAFRSRIDTALGRIGVPVRFAAPARLADATREEGPPSLILLDLTAGEEGFSALAALKSDPRTREIPVIAYGPHRDLAARERALEAGADDVVANSEVASNLPALLEKWIPAAGAGAPLRLGHSPDPDDAFMYYPLAAGAIDTEGLRFEQVLKDIETLNRLALEGQLEMTAASVHAYGHLAGRYAILPGGGSFGDGYGPLLVSREPLPPDRLSGKTIAVPGTLTSAFLALRLYAGEFEYRVVPFDGIPQAVAEGTVDLGLLIHEGQLTYAGAGLHRVADLGEWWGKETGLPLPLGVNLVRKDLGPERCRRISRVWRRSIEHALGNRDAALTYALDFGRGLSRPLADRFVGMYVNELTRDPGERGRRAIALFLERGHQCGLIPRRVVPEFIDG
jgi:1,4-dihydroxy-6-naphthoate synthase